MSEEDNNNPSPVRAEPLAPPPPACEQTKSKVEPFGEGFKITLSSPYIRVELLTYGASINSVCVRDPHKPVENPSSWLEVCLGYTNPEELKDPVLPRGSTRGRFAGRIADGEFTLNNSNYKLLQNMGGHTLHGGPQGFDKHQWKYIVTEGEDEIGVSFHLTSPHLDQGFPGELFVTATYTILKKSTVAALKYVYQASLSENTPVEATVVNLTNNAYWNLNGVPRPIKPEMKAALPSLITNHCLQVPAKHVAVMTEDFILKGEMTETTGTVNDYNEMRPIIDGMLDTEEMGRDPWGYDDAIALDTWDATLREAATLYSPDTQLQMRVSTTNPVVVIYTANALPKDADGTKGRRFQQHSGVALMCEYFPNSPNVSTFPSTVLNKGETYQETTVHEFQFLSAKPVVHNTPPGADS